MTLNTDRFHEDLETIYHAFWGNRLCVLSDNAFEVFAPVYGSLMSLFKAVVKMKENGLH